MTFNDWSNNDEKERRIHDACLEYSDEKYSIKIKTNKMPKFSINKKMVYK